MTEHPAARRQRIQQQKFATPADAAFLINRDKRTINRWITKGLPAYEIGGQRFVRLDEVRAYALDETNDTRTPSRLMPH